MIVSAIRKVIRRNLDKGFAEGIQYRSVCYYVPHSKFPAGYHCDPSKPLIFASLASQKNHLSLHLMSVYHCGDDVDAPAAQEAHWFRTAWLASGRKLDMGRACIRFKKVEDIPLDVIGQAFRRMTADKYIANYLAALGGRRK